MDKDSMDKESMMDKDIIVDKDSILDKDSIPESKKIFAEMPYKDKPDRVPSDNISLFDLHEDMQFVDAIAIDELNKRVKTEGDELLEEVWRKESPDEKEHFDNA